MTKLLLALALMLPAAYAKQPRVTTHVYVTVSPEHHRGAIRHAAYATRDAGRATGRATGKGARAVGRFFRRNTY